MSILRIEVKNNCKLLNLDDEQDVVPAKKSLMERDLERHSTGKENGAMLDCGRGNTCWGNYRCPKHPNTSVERVGELSSLLLVFLWENDLRRTIKIKAYE